MKLFNKKESCCNVDTSTQETQKTYDAKVLGSGCAKCNQLSENLKIALTELNLPTDIQKITSMPEIAQFGVMSTPALVYKNKVISYGKVLSVSQIKELLTKFGN